MTVDEILGAIRRQTEVFDDAIRLVALMRKRVLSTDATDADREALVNAEAGAVLARDNLHELERELMTAAGITEEMVQAAEAESERQLLDPVDRSERRTITGNQVETTTWAEQVLPAGLEQLMSLVDADWLREEAGRGYRLGEAFLTEPLSLIRGVRTASETGAIHRFAQMLLVAQDSLNHPEGYDLFAGALLTAQASALGANLHHLSEITGDVGERISALWRLPSDKTDATVYELLVAAACVREGRKMEFLTTEGAGHGEKVPDLRVHDYPFPLVVECKRRVTVTAADIAEEAQMLALYAQLRAQCRQRGLFGLFELRLTVEAANIPMLEVIAAAVRQRLVHDPEQFTEYAWGSISFHERSSVIDGPPTPLYSPLFLGGVFGWNTDLPPHDGLICQVERPDHYIVDRVVGPIGLAWTNESPVAFKRRARTVSGLFGKAIEQIPRGEMGAIYICYQEGDREHVADDRTRYLREQMNGWEHSASIRVPLTVLSRIVPRPLNHGQPDLVETAIPFVSELTGGSVWLQDLPMLLFTA